MTATTVTAPGYPGTAGRALRGRLRAHRCSASSPSPGCSTCST
jgi:hypothetical protein